jgi:hypothetical protein
MAVLVWWAPIVFVVVRVRTVTWYCSFGPLFNCWHRIRNCFVTK